jgi:uncharacterized protein YbaR (Trm112 family)
MHIELTEMLACPEPHAPDVLVLSTAQMKGRMVYFGLVGCPKCRKEYQILNGVVDFTGRGKGEVAAGAQPKAGAQLVAPLPPDATVQALLDLSGPGGFVVLLGEATQHAPGLAALMGGIHFVGINAPAGVVASPSLSLLVAPRSIPLRASMARGVVVGASMASTPWLEDAVRVLLRGRRLVMESSGEPPAGMAYLAEADGLWVGEKT